MEKEFSNEEEYTERQWICDMILEFHRDKKQLKHRAYVLQNEHGRAFNETMKSFKNSNYDKETKESIMDSVDKQYKDELKAISRKLHDIHRLNFEIKRDKIDVKYPELKKRSKKLSRELKKIFEDVNTIRNRMDEKYNVVYKKVLKANRYDRYNKEPESDQI